MSESFAQLFEESLASSDFRIGGLMTGTIVRIEKDVVVVNAGLKSEGFIPTAQFFNEKGELEVQVGDQVEVVLDAVEDGFGETRLSRERAKRLESWSELEKEYEAGNTIRGMISGRVKGGFIVDVKAMRAFLPGSLVDVRPVRDPGGLEGQELEFKIIKMDQKRNNIVVSRRSVIEQETSAERDALLSTLEEGQKVKGVVKNLTDYGAFIDLGGIDGLLHITDMSWRRIKHPSELVQIGDEIDVRVLKFDKDKSRVSLGLKQLGEDPWVAIKARYPEEARLTGRVTNITDYGCFVQLEEGIEGLVHVSEMDWTNKNVMPSKLVAVGDEIDVLVLEIDEERRRISLGMKQCVPNPWKEFSDKYNKGDKVAGKIKSITDFGLFIGLDGGIDGLVHLSDISWNENGEEAVRNYKKGEEVEAVVLSVDSERERVSLGIKQLEQDPFTRFVTENEKGAEVSGAVADVDGKGVTVDLGDGVEGFIRTADVTEELKAGDAVSAYFVAVDRKNRNISLSMTSAEQPADKVAAVKAPRKEKVEAPVNATLGDLFKAAQAKDEE
ncbi:30S ribosomal protein S1 [Piscirickettsia salmonis]|uniref:30S ribosomal protein S1 n=1 Tax=Piscirickettsia salmonis TaxID=1238 RepID=UPI0007C9351E|nr:30S ribosomal protein S1 [Piscirickettsiaceae bacterium NZ-RLO1]